MNAPARLRQLGVFLTVFLSLHTLGQADSQNKGPQGYVFTINEENDKFVTPSTDKHYTQGLHLLLLWPDDEVPMVFQPLALAPDFGIAGATRKFGFAIGQNIYTPTDTQATSLIVTDRPYAGWLYLGLVREVRGTSARGIPTFEHLELDLGVIGSDSLAHEAQAWFHQVVGDKPPEGWKHQLHNEPAVLIVDDRRWLFWENQANDGFKIQLIPKASLKLGNVETSAKIGAMMRLGHHIADEFSKTMERRVGWYAFSEIDARGVLHNAFLDGNLITDSPSVAKEPGVAELHIGVGFTFKQVEFRYTYNYLTREFKLQDKYDAYGSFDLICRF